MYIRKDDARADKGQAVSRTRAELLVFGLLALLVWPVLTVGFVGAYGFAVWMGQQVYGPPQYGHSPHAH